MEATLGDGGHKGQRDGWILQHPGMNCSNAHDQVPAREGAGAGFKRLCTDMRMDCDIGAECNKSSNKDRDDIWEGSKEKSKQGPLAQVSQTHHKPKKQTAQESVFCAAQYPGSNWALSQEGLGSTECICGVLVQVIAGFAATISQSHKGVQVIHNCSSEHLAKHVGGQIMLKIGV